MHGLVDLFILTGFADLFTFITLNTIIIVRCKFSTISMRNARRLIASSFVAPRTWENRFSRRLHKQYNMRVKLAFFYLFHTSPSRRMN